MPLHSGKAEGFPYSLSRYTDVLAGKWEWLAGRIRAGYMEGIKPGLQIPSAWSLAPADTDSLVFWTKDPRAALLNRAALDPYRVVMHVTATGWHEVEKGAPDLHESGQLLVQTAQAYRDVTWRFSPIPLLPDPVVLERFGILLEYAEQARLKSVFVSYLQPNAQLPENRGDAQRFTLLHEMGELAKQHGVQVLLCQDDRSLMSFGEGSFQLGICQPGVDKLESCGCAMMVDPFTVNEACVFGCAYCYVGDATRKKLNTTKLIQVRRRNAALR